MFWVNVFGLFNSAFFMCYAAISLYGGSRKAIGSFCFFSLSVVFYFALLLRWGITDDYILWRRRK